MKNLRTLFAATLLACSGSETALAANQPAYLDKIEHIVVIYLENHSFDSLFGLFPGARGLADARYVPKQVDQYGRVYETLPPVMEKDAHHKLVRSPHFPDNLPNQPFDIGQYQTLNDPPPDLTHRYYLHQMQINGGHNDRFAQLSSAGALTLGHYNLEGSALWRYAREYTLADNFFQAAFGGSFLNHQWLACACMPQYPNAPDELKKWQIDPATGRILKDPDVTPEGYAVATIQPHYPPFDPEKARHGQLPPQTAPTLGDRLSERKVNWAWYSGGWDDAVAEVKTKGRFQYHHQPYAYYANYAPGTDARRQHLKDEKDLMAAIAANKLPAVAFYKPVGIETQHPDYASIADADRKLESLVESLKASKAWKNMAIIITYDEFGGFWDHVPPPSGDAFGPGTRIPAIIMSPLARKGYIDHTRYDTTSILKFIELRHGLKPLTARDARADGLSGAFEATQP
jgi:phospholipase C